MIKNVAEEIINLYVSDGEYTNNESLIQEVKNIFDIDISEDIKTLKKDALIEKLKDQALSNYEKKEIFELYANTAYFGSGYYGIYDAAMGYFGKMPSELTDYEAAMLAGLPNAPSVYSPDTNMDLAVQRVRQVLDSMVENDILTEEEAEAIMSEAPKV